MSPPNSWQRWLKAPHTLWFRRLLFQIHLWSGISLGLYILVISLTGSAILLQPTVIQIFVPSSVAPSTLPELKGDALNTKIAEVYSDYDVYMTVPSYSPERATYVVLNKDGGVFPRFFDQFSGQDLGPSNPPVVLAFEWLVNVHDDLLAGRKGRQINGIGGGALIIMSLTGLVIWWPGRKRWKDGLLIQRNYARGFNWQLHRFLGFWSLFLMFTWGLTGLHLGFPVILNSFIDWLDTDLTDFERPNQWLRFLMNIHFARLGEGSLAHWAWTLASLTPTVMVISGFIIWWKRIVLKKLPY